MKQTTYLVTGAAGFIGSAYVRALAARNPAPRIVAVDALTYAGNIRNISELIEDGKVEFVKADIRDAAAMDTLIGRVQPDYVVHFAAESHVDRSIDGPGIFVQTNVLGTQVLLEACRRLRDKEAQAGATPSLRRFVQVSTDEVYGHLEIDCPQGRELSPELAATLGRPDSNPVAYGTEFFSESTPLNPTSPYSASKASADLMALAYARTFRLPVSVTRCSNNYGPRQFPEKLIPLVINNILEGKPLPVYGRGLNVRDWLHVSDHCAAINAVIEHGRPGEVYNIGGFNERRNIDLVGAIIRTVRSLIEEEPEKYGPLCALAPEEIDERLITFVGDRPAHDARYAIDSTKIMEETGWKPRVHLDCGGLRECVRWYLDNRAWTADIVRGDYREYYNKMYSRR